jgi:hypothetical protein
MKVWKLWRWPWKRCRAYKEPNKTGYWGRCDLEREHEGDHLLERGMDMLTWSTKWTDSFGVNDSV